MHVGEMETNCFGTGSWIWEKLQNRFLLESIEQDESKGSLSKTKIKVKILYTATGNTCCCVCHQKSPELCFPLE